MAEARRETRTVETAVTVLELTGPEAEALAHLLSVSEEYVEEVPELRSMWGALKGAADQSAPLAVGDMVTVTAEVPDPLSHEDTGHTGTVGKLLKVDTSDDNFPYQVQKPGGSWVWVHAVKRVGA